MTPTLHGEAEVALEVVVEVVVDNIITVVEDMDLDRVMVVVVEEEEDITEEGEW